MTARLDIWLSRTAGGAQMFYDLRLRLVALAAIGISPAVAFAQAAPAPGFQNAAAGLLSSACPVQQNIPPPGQTPQAAIVIIKPHISEGSETSVVPAATLTPADPAVVLLQQATFWRAQNEQDKAAGALRRLLLLEPNNVDALALLAQIDAEQGNAAEAQSYYDRLRQVAPSDPRLPAIVESIQSGSIDQIALSQARRLVGLCRSAQAVQEYQVAFHSTTPPATLAVEYYGVLAETGLAGFEQARKALAAIVAANPDDAAVQLAYARLLTQREFTRTDGINRLQALTKVPSIAASAAISWRQVLLWEGPSIEAMAQLRAYLAVNPSDPALDAQMQNFKENLPDDGEQARNKGFEAIHDGQWTEAETDFQAALNYDAKDWKAMMMLAAIRNHEKRAEDAHVFILQALALKPDQHDLIMASSGGDWSKEAHPQATAVVNATAVTNAAAARLATARAAAAIRGQYQAVAQLSRRGRYAEAENLLRRLSRGRANANTDIQMGDIQLMAGDKRAAEASFRTALRAQPASPDAAAGLARVLTQNGRPQEAGVYYAQAEAGYRRTRNGQALVGMNALRAQEIRAQADALSDPQAQIPLYRTALAIAPNDPWIRLSLARTLQKQGNVAEARQVMQAGDSNDAASIEANVYFAQGLNDPQLASSYIDRLPARRRTANMVAVQQQAATQAELANIDRLPTRAERLNALLTAADAPDPSGARGQQIGHALVVMGAQGSVKQAIDSALAATRRPTARQKLAYSSALAEAGAPEDANAMLQGIDDRELAGEQQAPLDDVRNTIAVAKSDELNTAKRPADAYDALAPRLAAHPNDPSLKLALSRIYDANGKPEQALAISQQVLQASPGDVGVRLSAIGSAISAHDYGLADTLVRQGLATNPSEPRLYLLAADLDQAEGARIRAVHDLQMARALRQRQITEASP